MHAAYFLKCNHTILIMASVSVRNIVFNTCNSELHKVIYASTSPGRGAVYSENEMFVRTDPCREMETKKSSQNQVYN
jgi:hypothetical protein